MYRGGRITEKSVFLAKYTDVEWMHLPDHHAVVSSSSRDSPTTVGNTQRIKQLEDAINQLKADQSRKIDQLQAVLSRNMDQLESRIAQLEAARAADSRKIDHQESGPISPAYC